MLINVLKFGGTSVANLKRIENVVKIVEKRIKDNSSKIILVVSAMSGVTNELVKEFKKIRNEISDPEYDVIVSTGEQSSSALISSLLNKKKIESRSLLGWQIPILTDGNHSKARIIKINSNILKDHLAKYRVLVIAGFQGISKENRITTLGRGGSDLTAIALAASIMFLFLFTQVNLASITIRRLYEKTVDYGFKTPFFPAVPIIGIITAMGLSIYLLVTHPKSWIIAVVYTKITNKTFDDLPNRYWEFFILGGFILWIAVIQLLT